MNFTTVSVNRIECIRGALAPLSYSSPSGNPSVSPFEKGRSLVSPFGKGGIRGILEGEGDAGGEVD